VPFIILISASFVPYDPIKDSNFPLLYGFIAGINFDGMPLYVGASNITTCGFKGPAPAGLSVSAKVSGAYIGCFSDIVRDTNTSLYLNRKTVQYWTSTFIDRASHVKNTVRTGYYNDLFVGKVEVPCTNATSTMCTLIFPISSDPKMYSKGVFHLFENVTISVNDTVFVLVQESAIVTSARHTDAMYELARKMETQAVIKDKAPSTDVKFIEALKGLLSQPTSCSGPPISVFNNTGNAVPATNNLSNGSILNSALIGSRMMSIAEKFFPTC
jgi:hypothetical protein